MIEPNVFPKQETFGYACEGYPTIGQLIDYGLTEKESESEYSRNYHKQRMRKKRKYQRRSK